MEFFTVTRNGESLQVAESELNAYLADGWSLGGTKRVTTEEGERTLETEEALTRPTVQGIVSEDEIIRRRGAEAAERIAGDQGIQAFGESALTTLIPFVGDEIVEGIAGLTEGDPGMVALRARQNRGASTIGSAAGAVVGALAPGGLAKVLPGGLVARGASRAGKAARGVTGSRVVGGITEGVVDAVGFGALQRASQAMLLDEPVTAERIVAGVPTDILFGAALGGTFSAIGRMGSKSKEVIKGLDDKVSRLSSDLASDIRGLKTAANAKKVDSVADALQTGLTGKKAIKNIENIAEIEKAAPILDKALTSNYRKVADELASENPMFKSELLKFDELTDTGKQLANAGFDVRKVAGSPMAESAAKAYVLKQAQSAAAAAPKASKSGGLLDMLKTAGLGSIGGAPGALAGVLGRSMTAGKSRVGPALKGFIKHAGKPRRGNVPAAATVLNSVDFGGGKKEPFEKKIEKIREITVDDGKLRDSIDKSMGPLRAAHPGVADKVHAKQYQKMKFLADLSPKGRPGTAFQKVTPVYSSTAKDKFNRIFAAAEDPYRLMDELSEGKLTQETVDTVKQLYPEIYAEMQMEIIENIDEIREKVGYQGRLQLGIMFQVPTDEVLEPAFIQRMQMNYLQREQEQSQDTGGQYSTPGSLQNKIESTATASQRLQMSK